MAQATDENTLELEAAKAAEAAQKAKDAARAAEAKAAAAKKLREEEEESARDKLEALRRDTYDETYRRPVEEKRAALDEVIADGGDILPAWIEYRAALRVAGVGKSAHEGHVEKRARAKHEAVVRQVNEWNRELQHMAHTGNHGTPYVEGNPPSGWWTPTIDALTANVQPQTTPGTRVQQINGEINRLAEALGKDLRRDPDDDTPQLVLDLIEPPRSRPHSVPLWMQENRTYFDVLKEVIDSQISAQAKQRSSEITDQLKAQL